MCLVATAAFHLGLFPPVYTALIHEYVFNHFEVWNDLIEFNQIKKTRMQKINPTHSIPFRCDEVLHFFIVVLMESRRPINLITRPQKRTQNHILNHSIPNPNSPKSQEHGTEYKPRQEGLFNGCADEPLPSPRWAVVENGCLICWRRKSVEGRK